nr:hypothetical protein Iba_chr13aCG7700 [Ipomoea batatas]
MCYYQSATAARIICIKFEEQCPLTCLGSCNWLQLSCRAMLHCEERRRDD